MEGVSDVWGVELIDCRDRIERCKRRACLLRFEVMRSNAAFSKMSATRQASAIESAKYLRDQINKTQSASTQEKDRLLRYGGESAGILCLVLTVHERPSIFQHLDPRLRGQRLPTSGKGAADTACMFRLPSSLVVELHVTFR